MRVRAATLNLCSCRMTSPERVAEVVRRLELDLLGLQEVRRLVPGVIDQAAAIAMRLGMANAFRASIGWSRIGFGNALLSREALHGARQIRLPGRGEPRSAFLAEVDLGGIAVQVLVTHLGLTASDRAVQLSRILENLDAARPTVLLADWNAAEDSLDLCPLHDAGFRPAIPLALLTFPAHQPRLQLDSVWVSEHFRAVSCETIPEIVSDHLAVIAELKLG